MPDPALQRYSLRKRSLDEIDELRQVLRAAENRLLGVSRVCGSAAAGQVGEAGEVLDERQADLPGGAVAVLGHDDLGRPLIGRMAAVALASAARSRFCERWECIEDDTARDALWS